MIGLIVGGVVLLVAAGIVAMVMLLRRRRGSELDDVTDDAPDHEMFDDTRSVSWVEPGNHFKPMTQMNQLLSTGDGTWGEMIGTLWGSEQPTGQFLNFELE
jgi:hypothetical protein